MYSTDNVKIYTDKSHPTVMKTGYICDIFIVSYVILDIFLVMYLTTDEYRTKTDPYLWTYVLKPIAKVALLGTSLYYMKSYNKFEISLTTE